MKKHKVHLQSLIITIFLLSACATDIPLCPFDVSYLNLPAYNPDETYIPPLTLDEIIYDCTHHNEIDPHGWFGPADYVANAPGKGGPDIKNGNRPPEGWNSITLWGTAGEVCTGSGSTNTLVAVTRPELYIYSKSKNKWVAIKNTAAFNSLTASGKSVFAGKMYTEKFPLGAPEYKLETTWLQSDLSLGGKPGNKLVFHFWPSGGRMPLYNPEGIVDASDIGAILMTFLGRLVVEDPAKPDDRNKARFVMKAGADYWAYPGMDGTIPLKDRFLNPSVGNGRYKLVTKNWRHFTHCTLGEGLRNLPLPPGVTGE